MNVDQRTKLLHRIMSDYFIILINNNKYIIRRPTSDIQYQAQLVHENILLQNRFNDWMGENECISHLISIGRWTVDGDQKMDEIEKYIENQKVELYQSVAQPNKVKQIRKQLFHAKEILGKLHDVKYSLYSFTLRGFAQSVKQQYILEHTIYHNDKLLSDISYKLLEQIKIKMCDFLISHTEFRELARTDPWRSYWGVIDNPFSKSIVELDYDKRTLMTYSKMYDNIAESPECPDEKVLEDDDMLDGWMILQKRSRDEKKNEKHTDNVVNHLSAKYQNASEIFVPVQSKEEITQIEKMNTVKGRVVKKQRQQLLDKQGQVGVGKLPDEILTRQTQANEEFKNRASKH